jgi:hypothetical protein
LDTAPKEIPTLKQWRIERNTIDGSTRVVGLRQHQDGTNDWNFTTGPIKNPYAEIVYGKVVEDNKGNRYFLFDSTKENEQKSYRFLHYDDNGNEYFQKYQADVKIPILWPPDVNSQQALIAREKLSAVDSGLTVRDVLERYNITLQFGSCLQMPRLLYGSKENTDFTSMAPNGFHDKDFVTLRYRWHSQKGNFEANKYQKTMIDVSIVPMDMFKDMEAYYNIHQPLKSYCPLDIPSYSLLCFAW